LDLAEAGARISLKLLPGQKLCPTCKQKLRVSLENPKESGPEEDISALDNSLSMEEEHQTVTNCFSTIGLSPLKSHSQCMACKITAGKCKISDAVSSIKDKVAKIPVKKKNSRKGGCN